MNGLLQRPRLGQLAPSMNDLIGCNGLVGGKMEAIQLARIQMWNAHFFCQVSNLRNIELLSLSCYHQFKSSDVTTSHYNHHRLYMWCAVQVI